MKAVGASIAVSADIQDGRRVRLRTAVNRLPRFSASLYILLLKTGVPRPRYDTCVFQLHRKSVVHIPDVF